MVEGGYPLVIVDAAGRFVDLGLQIDKGCTKSLEQGELWLVDHRTGRLLPREPHSPLLSIEKRGSYCLAAVGVEEPRRQSAGAAPQPAAAADDSEKFAAVGVASMGAASVDAGQILAGLAATIAARRREMPPGSYTTHLFSQGVDKIRKKTGEEAVELILARSPGEVISEAADLVYHLLVLLEAEGLGLEQLISELDRRNG